MKPFKLHFSEALVRSAVWAFWRRVTGWKYWLAIALLLGSFIYGLWSGDRSWFVGASGTILALGIAFAIAIYAIHFRGSIARLRRMKSPEATFEVGEDRFRITSDVGSSELSWKTVTEVWQFPEFWLLFFSPAHFITLPLADLDNDARELILSRAKSHGAKIA
jgi:hypothetical protein